MTLRNAKAVLVLCTLHFAACGPGNSGGLTDGGSGNSLVIQRIVATQGTNFAWDSEGGAWWWGQNPRGLNGDSTWSSYAIPSRVPLLDSMVTGQVGWSHGIYVRSDGTVWGAGSNLYKELGLTTPSETAVLTQTPGLANMVSVAAAGTTSFALAADGKVWSWGDNEVGELGSGSLFGSRSTPAVVVNLSGVKAIAAGDDHVLALVNAGTVWAWGGNGYGELGNGSTPPNKSAVPVQVSGLSNVKALAASTNLSVALTEDGSVWTWGYNNAGQMGTGTAIVQSKVPVKVTGLSGITAIAAGLWYVLALKSDGTVWSWGYNAYGELADGTFEERNTPRQVSTLSGIVGISAGEFHALALDDQGAVWSWGVNSDGELGSGVQDNTRRRVPEKVQTQEQ
jgi:alpha-tubulin suppressor-like RCC1 family protein